MRGIEFMSVLARASEHAGAMPLETELHPSPLMIVSKLNQLETMIKDEIARQRKTQWQTTRLKRLQQSRHKPLKMLLQKQLRLQSPLSLAQKRQLPSRMNVSSALKRSHKPLWTLLYSLKSGALSRQHERRWIDGTAN